MIGVISMAEKTKQHFVPKLYLRNFAQGKKFNIYNQKNDKIINNVSYEDQCYKNNFYGKDKFTENELSTIESSWGSAIKNILNDCENISNENEKLIKQFCCFQYLRTEKAVLHTQNSLFDMTRKVIPILLKIEGKQATQQQTDSFAYKYSKAFENTEKTTQRQIKMAKDFFKKLYNLKMLILENNTDLEFITSDNPIIIGNEFQKEYGLGVDCMGIYFLFPLSPKIYILLYDYKIYTSINNKKKFTIDKKTVQKLNIIQYENSLENVFSLSSNGINFIKAYIDMTCQKIRQHLRNEYNRTRNNFLSQKLKGRANDMFKQYLDCIDNKILSLYCKKGYEKIDFDFLVIDDLAKPFQNMMNYTMHRSATKKKVEQRIQFMKSINNPNSELPFKEKLYKDSKTYDLTLKWEYFLKQYFKL